ncbi:hypothetical protein GWI33_017137 [Rhynchophorus ferrugineus]|uniref:Uncharacterized protein n=1 Tax=Rhynchophorus ferrugineus TaxID=354439 RepID=A0A834M7Y1_RHYFE|nr:hypothetical protein GWI33_017137 [Rhynchophorus ferrugineus]
MCTVRYDVYINSLNPSGLVIRACSVQFTDISLQNLPRFLIQVQVKKGQVTQELHFIAIKPHSSAATTKGIEKPKRLYWLKSPNNS